MSRGLTQKQEDMLGFLIEHVERFGCPPSIRETMRAFGFKTLRGVTVHWDALEHKGYIVRGSCAREMRVRKNRNGEDLHLRFEVTR